MVGRDRIIGKKHSRNTTSRVIGASAGASLFLAAAAAMATGSAAPAKADFDDLLDPIIQPILTQVTDSISVFDPALATDLTSWTDTFLADLNSLDSAVAAASTGATAAASSASPASASGTYDLPITIAEDTEPTVQATVDGASTTDLVDTGSSGLVVPLTDLDGGSTNFLTELETLYSLGSPVSFGESGYSGGVDYIYLTYDEPVDYATTGGGTLDTTDVPVEVEVYSWDPSDLSSLFTNDAFQGFLGDNDVTGILGIGDSTSGGAGESPIEAAGFNGVTVDEPDSELIVSSTPDTSGTELTATGSTVDGLTETVTSGSTTIGSATVNDDLDSGGVYGTIPSSIDSSTLADGDVVKVYDGNTLLYEYTVGSSGADGAPTVTSGDDIDSGVQPFLDHEISIDYETDTLYLNN